MRMLLLGVVGLVLAAPPLWADTPPARTPVPSTTPGWEDYGVDEALEEEVARPPVYSDDAQRAGLKWGAAATFGSVVAWMVGSQLLQFLGAVPLVGQVLPIVNMFWPILASGIGWYVGTKEGARRIPLVPTVLVGALAQVITMCACMPGTVCFGVPPFGCITIPLSGVLQGLANAGATYWMMERYGRARVEGEPERSWDFFSVPEPTPMKRKAARNPGDIPTTRTPVVPVPQGTPAPPPAPVLPPAVDEPL